MALLESMAGLVGVVSRMNTAVIATAISTTQAMTTLRRRTRCRKPGRPARCDATSGVASLGALSSMSRERDIDGIQVSAGVGVPVVR